MKKITALLVLLLSSITITYAGNTKEDDKQGEITISKKYIPRINGTIRAKYEYQPEISAQRFIVKNARLSASGNVMEKISYKIKVDLLNEGKFRMLDAYIKYNPLKDLYFTLGQMRVPFTIDAHRMPHIQYFCNRSFLAKHAGNVRDVGFRGTYTLPDGAVKFDAGIFCGADIQNQNDWHKGINYSGKITFQPLGKWEIVTCVQKIQPGEVKIHIYDIGTHYTFRNLFLETEYLYKRYKDHAFDDVHALNAIAKYDFHPKKLFDRISIVGRYDYMTDHSNGKNTDSLTGALQLTHYGRERATGGLTFSFRKYVEIRMNYEKYFYGKEAVPLKSEQDKVVIEGVLFF